MLIKIAIRLHSLISIIVALAMSSLSLFLASPIGGMSLVVSLSIALISLSLLGFFCDKDITVTSKKFTQIVWSMFVALLGTSLLLTITRKSGYINHWLFEVPTIFIWLFFPGFFILDLLDRRDEIPFLLKVILSWPLSSLLVVLLGVSFYKICRDFGILGFSILSIEAFLFILSILQRRKLMYKAKKISVNELLFLSGLVIFSISSSAAVIQRSPRVIGDMMYHLETALAIIKNPLNVSFEYPSAFPILLAVLIKVISLEPVLVYDLLFSLTWLVSLSLYLFMSQIMKGDKNLAAMGTILCIFSGYGGLVLQLMLGFRTLDLDTLDLARFVTSKTYDVIDFFVLIRPNIVTPIWIFGIPLFFTGLSILQLAEYKNVIKNAFLAIATVCLIVFYMPYFVFLIACTLLFLAINYYAKTSIIITLLIAESGGFLIDLLFLNSTLLKSSLVLSFVSPASVLWGSFLILILLYVLSCITSKMKVFSKRKLNNFLFHDRFYTLLRYLILIAYIISLILYLLNFTSLNAFEQIFVRVRYESIGYWYIPFYVEPIRLGISGTLATLFLFSKATKLKEDSNVLFLSTLLFIGLIGTQLLNIIRVYPAYRCATISVAGAGGLGAYLIQNWLDKRHYSKFAICTLVLFVGLLSVIHSMISMFLQFGQ